MSAIAECYRKLTGNNEPLRGYKVQDVNRTRKIGVACRNLQELKQKACAKLNVTDDLAEVGVYLMDGSEIDEEYFATLKPQTTLILRRPGEKLLTEADILYQMLRKVSESFTQEGERAAEFLTDKLKMKIAVLYKAIENKDGKVLCSRRDEDPDWFEGLENCAQTKEAYLHRRCQDRIRGYLYKAIEQIRSSEIYEKDTKARKQLQRVIVFLKLQLRKDHYFGYYFDRSRADKISAKEEKEAGGAADDETDNNADECCYEHCPCKLSSTDYEKCILGLDENDEVDAKKWTSPAKKDREKSDLQNQERREMEEAMEKCPYAVVQRDADEMTALCDEAGEFKCSGVWNLDKCSYADKHRINPYKSKEELVLFSTWNLDHKIERSRTLVPQLLEAAKKRAIDENEVHEFYENLFTVRNLRLVHIVCHDKGSHK